MTSEDEAIFDLNWRFHCAIVLILSLRVIGCLNNHHHHRRHFNAQVVVIALGKGTCVTQSLASCHS